MLRAWGFCMRLHLDLRRLGGLGTVSFHGIPDSTPGAMPARLRL